MLGYFFTLAILSNPPAVVRALQAEEFNSIYALNLLGNARIYGADGPYQGEGVFGSATQSPIAINLFVKNTADKQDKRGYNDKEDCRIYYRDIGSNLKRQEKLKKLTSRNWLLRLVGAR